MDAQILPFPPRRTAKEILSWIRDLAKASSNIHWSTHAGARMIERDISIRQALETVRQGRIDAGPNLEDSGRWKVTLRRHCAGQLVRVVLVVSDDRLLTIITVM